MTIIIRTPVNAHLLTQTQFAGRSFRARHHPVNTMEHALISMATLVTPAGVPLTILEQTVRLSYHVPQARVQITLNVQMSTITQIIHVIVPLRFDSTHLPEETVISRYRVMKNPVLMPECAQILTPTQAMSAIVRLILPVQIVRILFIVHFNRVKTVELVWTMMIIRGILVPVQNPIRERNVKRLFHAQQNRVKTVELVTTM